MMDQDEPQRLFESSEAPPQLRSLLVRAHGDVPSPAERALLVRAATEWGTEPTHAMHGRGSRWRWQGTATRYSTKLWSMAAVVGVGVGAGALYLAGVQPRHAARAPEPTSASSPSGPSLDVAINPGGDPEEPGVEGSLPAAAEPAIVAAPVRRVAATARPPVRAHAHRSISIPSGKADVGLRSAENATAGTSPLVDLGASSAARHVAPRLEANARGSQPEPEASPPASQPKPLERQADPSASPLSREDPRVVPAGAEETRLLRSARQSLARSPERTLALTEEHLRRYPHGLLDQEREALAIEALIELGRTDEARTRARAFEQAHSESPYRARIERAITQASGAVAPR